MPRNGEKSKLLKPEVISRRIFRVSVFRSGIGKLKGAKGRGHSGQHLGKLRTFSSPLFLL